MEWGNWNEDYDVGLGLGLSLKIQYSGWELGLEQRLGLKLVYRLKTIFELKVYLIGFGDVGLVRKYSQLNKLNFQTTPTWTNIFYFSF